MRRLGPFALGAALCVTFGFEREAASRGCSEVSDIVGYERCHRYGDSWAVERRWPLALALVLPYQRFDPSGEDFTLSRDKGPTLLTLPGRLLGPNALGSVGLGVRAEGFFWTWLYVGGEMGMTLGHNEITSVPTVINGASTALVTSNEAINTTSGYAAVFAGVRIPLGRVSLRLEGVAGGTLLTLQVTSKLGELSGTVARGELAPRGLVDFWLSPNVSVGAYAGFNALDTRDLAIGLVLEFHERSFDGTFAFW